MLVDLARNLFYTLERNYSVFLQPTVLALRFRLVCIVLGP
jgi:hypothetical protein